MLEDCRLGYQEILGYAISLQTPPAPGRGRPRRLVYATGWHTGLQWLNDARLSLLYRLDFRLHVREEEVHTEWVRLVPDCPSHRQFWQMDLMNRNTRCGTGSIWDLDETKMSDDFYHIGNKPE